MPAPSTGFPDSEPSASAIRPSPGAPAGPAPRPLQVAITGASGLVGSALTKLLTAAGHRVLRLVRAGSPAGPASPAADQTEWDPASGPRFPEALEGLDAVVHLAGASVADGRLGPAHLARVRESRVNGTRSLARALALLRRPPRAFVVASAIGFYGSRGDEVLTEASAPGAGGLLPPVCVEWEQAADPARAVGIRVACLRLGVVLSTQGGALPKMLLPFVLGLGGPIGSGRQYWSWITLDDAARAFAHVIVSPALAGPINLVSPQPVTNAQFTRDLGQALHRPTWLPMPAFLARLALGGAADELLLASARVVPERLLADGFVFQDPQLAQALARLLSLRYISSNE